MERQVGADFLDLDTDEQFARAAFVKPRSFDFGVVDLACDGAGYALMSIELELSGTVEQRSCDDCGGPRDFLVVEGSGQALELQESATAGAHGRWFGTIHGWDTDHVTYLAGPLAPEDDTTAP